MEYARLSSWRAPKEVIGNANTISRSALVSDTPSPLTVLDENDDPAIRRARNKGSTNEFTAMLEYIQLNTVKQISQIESKKSLREIELQSKIKHSEMTNQRLMSEMTSLRNHYTKLLSHEDDSNRTLLKIQDRLNRVGLLEYECHNKVEIERLTRLNLERKFEKEKMEMEDLVNAYKAQADKTMLQNQEMSKELDESQRLRFANEKKYSAKLFFYVIRRIYHRLQHRALCQWKGLTGAAVVQMISQRQRHKLEMEHQAGLMALEDAITAKHAEGVAALMSKHAAELGSLQKKCDRVTAARDKIYVSLGLRRRDKSYYLSEWKSQLLHTFKKQILKLKEEVKLNTECIEGLQSEINSLKIGHSQFEELVKSAHLRHLCHVIDQIKEKRARKCKVEALYKWRIASKDTVIYDAHKSISDMRIAVQSLEQSILTKEEELRVKEAVVSSLKQKADYLSERLNVFFL